MLPLSLLAVPSQPLDVLCLGAHADDIEIGCGGTLLELMAGRRLRVLWVVLSAAGERRAEARASAAAFLARGAGSEILVEDFRDGFFPYEEARIKQCLADIARRFTPALVFTHFREDAHQDHRTVAALTYQVFRNALILEYEVPKRDGDLANPNLFVPIGRATADAKVAALLRHFPSQRRRDWFRAETFEAMLRLRGMVAGAASGLAEGFYCRRAVLAGER